MQLTMGRPADSRQQSGTAGQAAHKTDSYKQNQTRQNRHAKSQPFDADDLRRRLYVVIAEQEAAAKKSRRERPEKRRSMQSNELDTPTSQSDTRRTSSAAPKSAIAKSGPSETSFAARMARSKISASDISKESADQSSEGKTSRSMSMSKSIQEKLRRKSSKADPTSTENAVNAASYHHVPQEAATQFERTATGTGMRERNLVHSSSQSALKPQIDGRRPSEQAELDAGITPAPQNNALERITTHREMPHERTQFRNPWSVPDERVSSEEGRRRHSIVGLAPVRSRRKSSFGNILEDEPLTVHPTGRLDPPLDEISSEETLAIDPATANEHRVDWTQSDEIPEKPKTAAAKIPLLRKADSLWTLKGKKGNPGKNGGQVRDEKIGAIREKQDEGFAAPSPPKFLRLGFLSRFKR
ncbi:hypothetical protein F5Y13DRAFT_173108 [Hypoxylon sp. FL1857]|nr:hypothetical protein F5Y13DRAFT_173108 [Hypoxylon sp. FL1857]